MTKQNISKFLYLFLFLHLFLWTLFPSLSNLNLPLDTIEALAWGSNLDWGYSKHPPLSALMVEIFFQIFGNQDWAFYLLSQIFLIISFFFVFKLAKEFFKNENLAFFSVLLLEGIYFYNFTSPEFNVNICQLPFWILSIFYSWRCIKFNKLTDFAILGLFFSLGILSKYIFLYLVIAINSLFLYQFLQKRKLKLINLLIPNLILLIMVTPHIIWLFDNNFSSILYGLKRSGNYESIFNHLINPLSFLIKQIIILSPFFLMAFFLLKNFKIKLEFKNEKTNFLLFVTILPIVFVLITSILIGAKIRTMWMTPFYLTLGILLIQLFKKKINLRNIKKFYFIFFFFFFLSPISYLAVSLFDETKRTDYPGKEISRLVQNKWDKNFTNEIKIVVGDEWFAGNLSYHLISRPKWINDLKDQASLITIQDGVIYTGNPKILKNICPGIFGTIKPVGYCMIGKR